MQGPQNNRDEMPGGDDDLLITGGNGFLGSHFLASWLTRHAGARAACLVRAGGAIEAISRVHAALRRAGDDAALPGGAVALLPRASAFAGELAAPDWVPAIERWQGGPDPRPLRVLHCAANLSFRASDRDAVRAINIGGTRTMLDAATRLGAAEFNYVSTAYVAGDRGGDILEDQVSQPAAFSNAYEESKWEAEALVRQVCAARGMAYRILRPSIIIADSTTYRLSALSGFYKVIETMLMLGRMDRNEGETILLPMPDGAMLDLIPVDVVVHEMIALMDGGASTCDQVFHLTSDSPLSMVDVLQTFSPLAGLSVDRLPEGAGPASVLAEFMMRRLSHYMPYLGQIRRFDRRNVRHAGIAPQGRLDIDRLRPFVASFLAQTQIRAHTPEAAPA